LLSLLPANYRKICLARLVVVVLSCSPCCCYCSYLTIACKQRQRQLQRQQHRLSDVETRRGGCLPVFACRLHSFSASLEFDLVSFIVSDSGMGYHMSARDITYIHIFKYISHVASGNDNNNNNKKNNNKNNSNVARLNVKSNGKKVSKHRRSRCCHDWIMRFY